VAVTRIWGVALLILLSFSSQTYAAVLPEERADALYHRYDGGGVTIDGPSILVRKNFSETVSISGNYYVDNVSSASIDVVTSGASEYGEKRTEYSVGADYLYGKSLFSAGYTNSDESDYTADTFYFNVSQDFFGDLTTLTFGYSLGQDDVFQNGNNEFSGSIDRHNFRLGVSQILTPEMIMSVNYELVTEEGYLNNPYRSYRYLSNPLDPAAGYQFAQEVYPDTRTSDSAMLRVLYYLPWRATVGGSYRFFTDDWGIAAHNVQLSYTHTLRKNWIFDVKYRYYQQSEADFYQDLFLFASQDDKDYRARDKELSEFNDHTLSLHIAYERDINNTFIDRAAVGLQWDHLWFEYDNFSDLTRTTAIPGEEPLYSLEANVYKVLFTVWY
tara:strand:+ start:136325 stop:137479 length:1155 start_codon:yes stop_codon:yes gene_type:complete